MTKEYISVIKSYIDKNPEASNSEIARIIKEKSNKLSHLSEGSLRNYISQVKAMPNKIVSTTSGHLMAETPAEKPKTTTKKKVMVVKGMPRIDALEVVSELLIENNIFEGNPNDLSGLLEDSVEQELVMFIDNFEELDKKGLFVELFGYGLIFEVIDAVNNPKPNKTVDPISVAAPGPSQPEQGNSREAIFADYYHRFSDLSNSALALKIQEDGKLSELSPNSLAKYIGQWKTNTDPARSTTSSNVSVETAGVIDASVANKNEKFEKALDILVVSVNDDLLINQSHFLNEYKSISTPNTIFVAFGDEPRMFNAGETLSTGSVGGSAEKYSLYDAIDFAITTALKRCDNPTGTDVCITIVSDRGVDFGSHQQDYMVADLIAKVKSRFGWTVNLAVMDELPVTLANSLSIDSSNISRYSNTYELRQLLKNARTRKNNEIKSDISKPVGYFLSSQYQSN
jgi:hypothetical protein